MWETRLLCIICLNALNCCVAYKALVVFHFPGKSHSMLGDGIVRHLLEDGHEVTYITTYPKHLKPHPSLREIDISSQRRLIPEDLLNIEKLLKNEVDINGLYLTMTIMYDIQVGCLEHAEVKKLLSDPKEQFDVVIIEWLFVELISGISAVFNCPYIWVSTYDPHWKVLKLIDELPNPAYNSNVQSMNVVPFTFMQRAEELLNMIYVLGMQYFITSSKEHGAYKRLLGPIIRNRGLTVPDLEEVRYNASLILGISHVSMGQPIRLPQNYKAIGGYYIDVPTNPLSVELKTVMDNAENGVIYFSLGSYLQSRNMPVELKASLLKMFGKLKQTILWKFEEDLPNRPSNVHIINWAPQQSILAHPNCILFITHGGFLSTTEAIHYGKPIIGIPVFADQFNNVQRSVQRGFAKKVDLSYTMTDELELAIKEITSNSSYTMKVKQLSFIYHDRPVSPGQELVHWVKHVVHTGGAPHLRSPALLVPWYQKCYLDLAVFVIVILYLMKLFMKKLIRRLLGNPEKRKTQ